MESIHRYPTQTIDDSNNMHNINDIPNLNNNTDLINTRNKRDRKYRIFNNICIYTFLFTNIILNSIALNKIYKLDLDLKDIKYDTENTIYLNKVVLFHDNTYYNELKDLFTVLSNSSISNKPIGSLILNYTNNYSCENNTEPNSNLNVITNNLDENITLANLIESCKNDYNFNNSICELINNIYTFDFLTKNSTHSTINKDYLNKNFVLKNVFDNIESIYDNNTLTTLCNDDNKNILCKIINYHNNFDYYSLFTKLKENVKSVITSVVGGAIGSVVGTSIVDKISPIHGREIPSTSNYSNYNQCIEGLKIIENLVNE